MRHEHDVIFSAMNSEIVGRIALVDPAKARNIEDRIIILAQQGQVATVKVCWGAKCQVTDEQIKQILEGMDTSTHTTVTVRSRIPDKP